jgi:hypothetical protein
VAINSKALAAALVSLVEDAAPSRLGFADPDRLEYWSAAKPKLVELGAFDEREEVRQAANTLRDAGNALFDLQARSRGELKVSEQEDFLRDYPPLHAAAEDAANQLLKAVAAAAAAAAAAAKKRPAR